MASKFTPRYTTYATSCRETSDAIIVVALYDMMVCRDYMVKDGWPVIAEDFSQWVVEDSFCNGKPAWDKVRAVVQQYSHAWSRLRRYVLS